jgi:hypothetical protein
MCRFAWEVSLDSGGTRRAVRTSTKVLDGRRICITALILRIFEAALMNKIIPNACIILYAHMNGLIMRLIREIECIDKLCQFSINLKFVGSV